MIKMVSIIFFSLYVHIGNTACYNVLVKNIFRVHMLKFGPNHLQTPKHFYHGYTQFKINILCGSFAIHKTFKHNRILFDLNFRRLRHFSTWGIDVLYTNNNRYCEVLLQHKYKNSKVPVITNIKFANVCVGVYYVTRSQNLRYAIKFPKRSHQQLTKICRKFPEFLFVSQERGIRAPGIWWT